MLLFSHPILVGPFVTHAAKVEAGAVSDDGAYAATATTTEICVWTRKGTLVARHAGRGTRYLDCSPSLHAFRAGDRTDATPGYRVVGTDGTLRDGLSGDGADRFGPNRFDVKVVPSGDGILVGVYDRLGILPVQATSLSNTRLPCTAAYSGVTKRLYVADTLPNGEVRIAELEFGGKKVRVVKKALANYGVATIGITPDGRRLIVSHGTMDPKNGSRKEIHGIGTADMRTVTDFTTMTWTSGGLSVTDLKSGKTREQEVFPETNKPEMAWPSFDGRYALVHDFATDDNADEMSNRAVRLWSRDGTVDLVDEALSVGVRERMGRKATEAGRRAEEQGRANVPAANGTDADYRQWLAVREGELRRDGARQIMTSPKELEYEPNGGRRWISAAFDLPLDRTLTVLTGAPLPDRSPYPFAYRVEIQKPRTETSVYNWDVVDTVKADGGRGIIGDRMCTRLEYSWVSPEATPGMTFDKKPLRLRIFYYCDAASDAEIRVYSGPYKKDRR